MDNAKIVKEYRLEVTRTAFWGETVTSTIELPEHAVLEFLEGYARDGVQVTGLLYRLVPEEDFFRNLGDGWVRLI